MQCPARMTLKRRIPLAASVVGLALGCQSPVEHRGIDGEPGFAAYADGDGLRLGTCPCGPDTAIMSACPG